MTTTVPPPVGMVFSFHSPAPDVDGVVGVVDEELDELVDPFPPFELEVWFPGTVVCDGRFWSVVLDPSVDVGSAGGATLSAAGASLTWASAALTICQVKAVVIASTSTQPPMKVHLFTL